MIERATISRVVVFSLAVAASLAAVTVSTPESAMGAGSRPPVPDVRETVKKGGAVKLQGGCVTVPQACSHVRDADQFGVKRGRIFGEGGFDITYSTYSDTDIACGAYKNVAAATDKNRLWLKEKTVNGRQVGIAYYKPNQLYVSFPKQRVNFSVVAKSQEEIDKALEVILTYAAEEK